MAMAVIHYRENKRQSDQYQCGRAEWKMLNVVFLTAFLLSFYPKQCHSAGDGGKFEFVGNWIVNGSCIHLKAEVGIELEYNTNDGKNSTGAFTVYPGATMVPDSTCSIKVLVDNTLIDAQLISLHYSSSYKIDLYFSTDPRVIGGKGEFALFKVDIWVNFVLMNKNFPNAKDAAGTYNQKVSLNEPPSDLASDVYAHKSNSYYCPSKKKYYIVKGDANTLKASISFKYLQVQAYANQAEFMKKEICPEDQQMNDTAPVIVGGILAALIIATLITYLVYRCRLSSQELALTGEEHEHEHHSHHEDHHFHHENAFQEKQQHHHVDHFKHDLPSESDKENNHQVHHKRPLHEQN